MLNFLKKPTKNIAPQTLVSSLVNRHGIERTASQFAQQVNELITNRDMALKVVASELACVSDNNVRGKRFVKNSGILLNEQCISPKEMADLSHTFGPAGLIRRLSNQLRSTPEEMVTFRTNLLNEIMKIHKLGKYQH